MKLHFLQNMRFSAALLVCISHSMELTQQNSTLLMGYNSHTIGTIGVSIFFMISGFIMIHTSGHKFGQSGAPRQFMIRRVVRVVPAYWLASAMAVAVAILGSGGNLGCDRADPFYIGMSFAFIASPRCDGVMQPILTQGWTLNYEMLFYIAFSISMIFSRKIGSTIIILLFSAPAIIGISAIILGYYDFNSIIGFYTNPIMLMFVIGLILGLKYREKTEENKFRLSSMSFLALTVAASLLVVTTEGSLDRSGMTVALLISAAIFYLATNFIDLKIGRFGKSIQSFGDASYSIYLLHIFVLVAFKKIWTIFGLWEYPIIFIALFCIAATAIGVGFYTFIERPINTYLLKRLTPAGHAKRSVTA